MKKTTAIISSLILAFALFTGCGTVAANPGRAEESTRLTQAAVPDQADQQAEAPVAETTAAAAETGMILSQEEERMSGTKPPQTQAAPKTTAVTLEKAKDIALKHAGVRAEDAVFTKVKQKLDDGVLKYRIDFTANGCEYEYSIHAGTGRVLEFEADYAAGSENNQTSANSSAATDVTLEKAKDIAVKHAGLTMEQVRFREAELDDEDGIMVYEIEFVCDGWEYEYIIHAGTGAVLEWDKDD